MLYLLFTMVVAASVVVAFCATFAIAAWATAFCFIVLACTIGRYLFQSELTRTQRFCTNAFGVFVGFGWALYGYGNGGFSEMSMDVATVCGGSLLIALIVWIGGKCCECRC